ncbi:unnamed protein product [Protopolystoma xenopodis]|uniref:Uncharacterized protein n=1 Tax=Protopolystoma xenopodis TaxID=117903 RepID=A0A3S5B0L6_9PLAT|nr:unnamed protein product [Protopolystoma xenopodis]
MATVVMSDYVQPHRFAPLPSGRVSLQVGAVKRKHFQLRFRASSPRPRQPSWYLAAASHLAHSASTGPCREGAQ